MMRLLLMVDMITGMSRSMMMVTMASVMSVMCRRSKS